MTLENEMIQGQSFKKIFPGQTTQFKNGQQDFPGGTVVKNPPANSGTRVRALVQEDPTCHGATKARGPQLLSLRSRAREPQLLKPARLEPVLRNKRSHCNEKPTHRNEE